LDSVVPLTLFDELAAAPIADCVRHVIARKALLNLLVSDQESLGQLYNKLQAVTPRLFLAGVEARLALDSVAMGRGLVHRRELWSVTADGKDTVVIDSVAEQTLSEWHNEMDRAVDPWLAAMCDFVTHELFTFSRVGDLAPAWLAADLVRLGQRQYIFAVEGRSPTQEFFPWEALEDSIIRRAIPDPHLPDGWAAGLSFAEARARLDEIEAQAAVSNTTELGLFREDMGERTNNATRWWFLRNVKGLSIRAIAKLAREEGVYLGEDRRSDVRRAIRQAQYWLCEIPRFRVRAFERIPPSDI